jgi:hypothetical protein
MKAELIDRTLRLLKEHEWDEQYTCDDFCVSCGRDKKKGHHADCEYVAVIAALETEREKMRCICAKSMDGSDDSCVFPDSKCPIHGGRA